MEQPTESDKVQLRESIESVLRDYIQKSEFCGMPVIEDWVLVSTVNDLDDDENAKWIYLRGHNQSTHRTVGLLTMASDNLRGIATADE
jgi:hypothetical protein